ncbi:response regulator [Ruminococcus albus]|uniref:Circadian input-output histidine kinase CikA n=1 Tax=Ruminococcus albus TaxID=1264 RepID=A0A1I1D5G6_RUMAL|nr:response regulator [Ruminococcus albus]SFB67853.1 PAS fold-containing protein [Ruminococcus albus]
MYYSAIGVLAALVLLIVNWDILWSGELYDKPAWNVYRKFLFAVLIYYITDILWGILESQKLSKALFVDTTLYFIAMAAGISFWAEYNVAYLNEKSPFGRFLKYMGKGIAGVITLLTVTNIFKPVLFTVDSSSVYKPLLPRNIMLVCQILFLLIISGFALTSMIRGGYSYEEGTRFRISASFGLFMAAFLLIQVWFPYLPLYSIAYMLGTCLLHAFVVNDEKEDRKRELAEAEKISELRDRFVSLLDNMPGMTFMKDASTGKYLACNRTFAEYARKDSTDEVVGLTDAQMFDAETAAHFVEDDRIALSMSKPYVLYEEVFDAAGKPKQLQTTKIRFKDSTGRTCLVGMCQDITDLVSIRREHAMTKEAYENAVNSGRLYNHIAQTLARDYTQMFCVNTDSEEFIEYRGGESGSTLSEVRRGWHFFSDCKIELCESVFSEDKEAFLTAMNRKNLMKALNCRDTFVMNYRKIAEDGTVYYSMKISRMENDEEHIIVGFKDVDSEMRETMAKNEALTTALDLAETANRSKTAFLAGMSHEIRTPINAIIGLENLALKNRELDSATKKYLEKIGTSAHHLLSVINNILVMSNIESGRNMINEGRFSLRAMLEQLNVQMESECGKKGLRYDCVILDEPEDSYIGDDKKLRQVLWNILSNAVKFTEAPGSVKMTVRKEAEHEDKVTLSFAVKDTGIGMDKDYLSKVFDAFSSQSEQSITKFGSSGLGMAITKRLVEMMNGSISVSSEKGEGTEFSVMVTIHRGDGTENVQKGEIDPQALYILVIDDSHIEAEHAQMVLSEMDIKADICTGGVEALRMMEEQSQNGQPYNIVLTDWNMPGMDGAETSAEILSRYGKSCIVVAMTAYSWDDIRDEANKVGVYSCLEKPLFTSNLLENLGRIARQSDLRIFKEKERARLAGRRILLAEDVDINAEILTDMLEMENIKVDHAANGKAAVRLFENSTAGIYSAILMDVRMPQMDGLQAARVIRAMDREDAKRIPIIALTANAFDEDVQLSVQAGMNEHLNKPVEAEHLIRVLGELIFDSERSLGKNV